MPNWCEGNVRFRGKQKDIKRFLMNEIIACKYDGEEFKNVEYKPTLSGVEHERFKLWNFDADRY